VQEIVEDMAVESILEKGKLRMIKEMAEKLREAGVKRIEAVIAVDEVSVTRIIRPRLPEKLDELATEFVDLVSDTIMAERWDEEVEELEDGYRWRGNVHGVEVEITLW